MSGNNGSKLKFEEWGKIINTPVVEREVRTKRKVSWCYIDFLFPCVRFNCSELYWDQFRTKSSIHWQAFAIFIFLIFFFEKFIPVYWSYTLSRLPRLLPTCFSLTLMSTWFFLYFLNNQLSTVSDAYVLIQMRSSTKAWAPFQCSYSQRKMTF